MATVHVELVSAEATVWSGEAAFVLARTIEGDIGILPEHAPLLSVLAESDVVITTGSGEKVVAWVGGGFLSVSDDRVSILAERAGLGARQTAEIQD